MLSEIFSSLLLESKWTSWILNVNSGKYSVSFDSELKSFWKLTNFLLKVKFNCTSGFNNKKIENHVRILEPDNG